MPYGTFQSWGQGGLIDVTSSKDRSLKVMNSIAAELTSNNVLDLQILPYCPCQEILDSRYRGRGFIKYLHDQCVTADDGEDYTDVIYVPSRLNFTLDIIEPINAMNFTSLSAAYLPEYCPDTYKVKYINDCTSLRLCSPNYNGMFEMNLAKNNMSVDFFNVDMTMRPHNPYIHMNPNFKGLYGQDFDDARGLICGGDFSLGIINDAWRQYEIQNKNYQAIFDRQIQNMDVNNAINKQEAWFQTGAGIMSGTVAGGAGGGVAGGGVGAAAGAILGAGASTLGGILDMQNLAARQKEARDFSIDNFNLQLGNIKALPYSITKTSALTANNKLFPFVEIYECTDVEKEAYFNKLTYDGFTLGVITHSFNDYRSSDNRNYFKGQLIRNTAIKGSTHEVNELAAEISKGVYI